MVDDKWEVFGGIDEWGCGVVVGGLEVFANGWGMVVSGWWVG